MKETARNIIEENEKKGIFQKDSKIADIFDFYIESFNTGNKRIIKDMINK